MKNFNELKNKLLRNKETRKAYQELAPQYAIIEMIIKKTPKGRFEPRSACPQNRNEAVSHSEI